MLPITLTQTKNGIKREFIFSSESIEWYVTAMGKDINVFLDTYTSADIDILCMNCNYVVKN